MSETLTRPHAYPMVRSQRASREIRCTSETCRRPLYVTCEDGHCGRRWFPVECACNPITYSESEHVPFVCKDFMRGDDPGRCARCGHDLPCHRDPPKTT